MFGYFSKLLIYLNIKEKTFLYLIQLKPKKKNLMSKYGLSVRKGTVRVGGTIPEGIGFDLSEEYECETV